ncbi:hypothetical protein AruPA_05505 [Acidiphilium sp. PA]|uniref:hypothetical protein n=1 Tax=Acidiphilium sp. PA TaxID=2871705 RepID=UPI0022445DE5|nr:hypothetical protein [Acidiphilium sp. PA]MCW8306485.1 hypothetical protein [Acidiphilium sp. PA]
MTNAIHGIVSVLLAIAGLVMGFVAYVDGLLARLMTGIGVPPPVQTVLLVVVAALLIVLAVRLFGRFLAALIVILLVLLLIGRIDPGLAVPQGHQPASLPRLDQPAKPA